MEIQKLRLLRGCLSPRYHRRQCWHGAWRGSETHTAFRRETVGQDCLVQCGQDVGEIVEVCHSVPELALKEKKLLLSCGVRGHGDVRDANQLHQDHRVENAIVLFAWTEWK